MGVGVRECVACGAILCSPSPGIRILPHKWFYISAHDSTTHTSFSETRAFLKHKIMVKEDPGSAPVPSTVVYINTDTIQPDYVTWSTFSTLFLNTCCLGFIAYVFSVKVSIVEGVYEVVAPPALDRQGTLDMCSPCFCMCDTLFGVLNVFMCLCV